MLHSPAAAAASEDSEADSLFGDAVPEAELSPDEVIQLHEEDESDAAPRRTAPEPGEPTKEEVETHRVDHYP